MADNSIERLKKKLYSREEQPPAGERTELSERFSATREGWDRPEPQPTPIMTAPHKERSILKMLFVAALIFFTLSLLVSAFFVFRGSNVVSAKNVSIEVEGPATVEGGEETVLDIAVVNENSIPITLVDLIVEFPEGTRAVANLNQELIRHRESLGTIKAGERVERTIRAVLFGEAGSEQHVKISVEYRIADSNAIFYKESPYKIVVSSAPLDVTVDTLSEVVSGQQLTLALDVVSNSKAPLKDVLLKAEYPFGFSFGSAQPATSFDTTVWELGDLPPGGKKHVVIKGVMSGQEGEERVFKFSAGLQSTKNNRELAAKFGEAQASMTVKRPFLSTDVALNGSESSEYVTAGGRTVRADITWTNNLPTQLFDVELEVKLNGASLNKTSVSADRGFYRSIDNTIVWNKTTDGTLSELSPGETGRASFSFSAFDLAKQTSLRNQKIDLSVSVKGKRVANSVPEELTASVTRTVKVETVPALASKITRNIGPFTNSGPLPPAAEKETTYTVTLDVSNSANNISGGKVTMSLPTYVRWVGAVSPSGEEVTYNPVGGVVTWNVGALPAGVGITNAPREVSFQIGFTPSVSQVGSIPVLVNDQTFTGTDTFTQTSVEATKSSLTTRLSEGGVTANHATVTQ